MAAKRFLIQNMTFTIGHVYNKESSYSQFASFGFDATSGGYNKSRMTTLDRLFGLRSTVFEVRAFSHFTLVGGTNNVHWVRRRTRTGVGRYEVSFSLSNGQNCNNEVTKGRYHVFHLINSLYAEPNHVFENDKRQQTMQFRRPGDGTKKLSQETWIVMHN